MKFFKRGDRNPKQQSFDREKIEITIAGTTYNVYDKIQAANIDTDIVEVMKKYHMTSDQATELMNANGGVRGIYTNIIELQKNAQNFGDLMKFKETAETMFNQLPAEIKAKYGNNLEQFFEQNKEQAEKEKKEVKQETETKDETK